MKCCYMLNLNSVTDFRNLVRTVVRTCQQNCLTTFFKLKDGERKGLFQKIFW